MTAATEKTLTQPQHLADAGLVAPDAVAELDYVTRRFGMAITPAMAALINPDDGADPIARQFVPSTAELIDHPLDVSDPIGDSTHSPAAGIVHRYPDRVLLLPVRVCPIYCRFCFRRESVGSNEPEMLDEAALTNALDYIRKNDAIWEVILSGGDPLVLSPRRLQRIIAELHTIAHVRVIRVHTRVPIADPSRITPELIAALSHSDRPVYVVLHTNHPRELTKSALHACKQLASAGISLLSQSVLLKGINDDAAVLETLFRELVANGIKPYYLHHADRAPGTAHFRTTVERGQQLMRELRGRLSGLCLSEYVLDIPGGHGKTPLQSGWISRNDTQIAVSDYQGNRHSYIEQNEQ